MQSSSFIITSGIHPKPKDKSIKIINAYQEIKATNFYQYRTFLTQYYPKTIAVIYFKTGHVD